MSKLRKSAKGRDCLVRIPGVCNHNPETTVLAHLNGGGMGMKQPDFLGSYCCSCCHDAIDGRITIPFSEQSIKLMHYDGMVRTQKIMIEEGLIECK